MRSCSSCGREIEGDFAFCPHCGAALAAAAQREQRKTVTVLFCDVTGSTALGESVDPEALRALLARYFERMKGIVEHHGGTVEKFIGDAVMSVFGVPVSHEDDALRAVRAAAEMRDALPELGVQARIGVNTGEVVTGTEERLATGDAVNVAARLEQAAPPGEILLGESTLALVGQAAEIEPLEPLELKGKAGRVAAYRLVRVHAAPERPHAARFVGRQRELAVLRDAWQRARAEQRCELVTVVGDAGVGKSRLAAEALAAMDATVVRARCLPYGEGITYWPIVEVLKQLDVLPPDEAAASAIRSLLGETRTVVSAEEIAWAFRKTLEHAAAGRPLVVVFDDVHWGEDTFLDLVEHVALLSSGAAVLLLCMARPELYERRPGWPVTLRLEPLPEEHVHELIPDSVPPKLRARIARAAGGNPLFVGEMVAMAGESEGAVVVPPTLQALLAARLDQLEDPERRVLERGAVEGEIFHRGAVQALVPADLPVTPRLAALVRKELIRPDRAQLAGEDGFRFRHLLIRDAAYDALPKATRAELHERFARWLEVRAAELVELDEILGYHLEQACRYRAELGLPTSDELVGSTRRRLAAAGRRASLRTDYRAAANLLQRAAGVGPREQLDLALELDLVDVLLNAGSGEAAAQQARVVAERASRAGDDIGELCARIQEIRIKTFVEPEGATEELDALVQQALPRFEAAGDDFALYTAYWGLGQVANMHAQMDAQAEAFERAAGHARRLGLPNEFLGWRAHARVNGTTPIADLLAWLDEQENAGAWALVLRRERALALAMLGRSDEARAMIAEVCAEMADRGGGIRLGTATGQAAVSVLLLIGDAAAAAEAGREGCRLLEELGERSLLSTAAGRLAQAFYELGRLEEADAWAGRSAELGASDDALTQMLWRQVRAKVLARRAELAEAERLAREAVALAERTDMLNAQADAHADLAEVLSLAGRAEDAVGALEQALARYERKGNLVMAGRTRERLAALREEEAAALGGT